MKLFWALLVLLMAGTVVLLMRRGETATSTEPGVVIPIPTHPRQSSRPEPEPDAPQNSRVTEALKNSHKNGARPEGAEAEIDPATTTEPVAPRVAAEGEPAPARIEERDDGSVLVDGRFLLRGEGTAESPYKVTWDHLLSAQDDYIPKEGRKKIPERIAMLDGKIVELTGHVAFPVMSETEDECLSMMNQWDGCCIGIPPTPYDAVEVRLRDAVDGKERLTTYGTVKGKLKVEPHLVGGWLVGLYVMDDAELSPTSYGGFAP